MRKVIMTILSKTFNVFHFTNDLISGLVGLHRLLNLDLLAGWELQKYNSFQYCYSQTKRCPEMLLKFNLLEIHITDEAGEGERKKQNSGNWCWKSVTIWNTHERNTILKPIRIEINFQGRCQLKQKQHTQIWRQTVIKLLDFWVLINTATECMKTRKNVLPLKSAIEFVIELN